MRKNNLLLFFLLLLLNSCSFFNEVVLEEYDTSITKVQFDKTNIEMNQGESEFIKLQLTPYEHQGKCNIKWDYDEEILSVNHDNFGAIITAKQPGTTYLKAKCNGIIATSIITIIEVGDDKSNPYIYSDTSVVELKLGNTTTISASLFGGSIEEMELFTWEIVNPEIADISFSRNNCIITSKKVGSTQIVCRHPKSEYEYTFVLYCYTELLAEPYITTQFNVLTLNKNFEASKKIYVDLVNPITSNYKQFFKWEYADEQSKSIINVNSSGNEAEIIPLSNGIAKIKVYHDNALYPLDIIVRVNTIVQNTYVDVSTTTLVVKGETPHTVTASIKNYEGFVDNSLFKWEIPEEAEALFDYSTVGNTLSIMGKKNGSVKVSVSHELSAYNRSVLIILQEQLGSAVDSSMYITTEQNYVQTKVGDEATRIGIRLIGGIEGEDNIGDESTNFTWWIKGGNNIVEVQDVTGIVKYDNARSAIDSGLSCNAYLSIKPLNPGEIIIGVTHPRCLYETEIKVKVYDKNVLVNPLVITTSDNIIRMLNGETKEVSVELRNAQEGDENKIEWSSDDSSVISISPLTGKTTTITAASGIGSHQTYITAHLDGALSDKKILVLSADTIEELQKMKGIYTDSNYLRISSGEKKELALNTFGLDASDKIKWTSNDSSLCVVNADGASENNCKASVVGISEGTTTITASLEGLENSEPVEFYITVLKEGESSEIFDENAGYLTTTQNAVVLENIDDSVSLSVAGVNIKTSDLQLYTDWTVSDTSLFNIAGSPGSNVTLTALDKGKANITVKNKFSENTLNISAKCGELYEWHDEYVIYITTENDVVNMISGTTQTIGCALVNSTSEGEFYWNVIEGSDIVSILGSKTGTCAITANKAGQAILSVSNSLCGELTKEILINVGNTEEELLGFKYITTTENVVTVMKGTSSSISVNIENTSSPIISGYHWNSSNTNVATVTSSGNIGVINATNIGTTKIIVENNECSYPLEIIVNVVDSNSAINDPYINSKNIATCYLSGESVVLTAELIGGTEADNINFSWNVIDNEIASVYSSNNTATVKGLKEGVTQVIISHPKAAADRKVLIIVEAQTKTNCSITVPESIIKLVPGGDAHTVSATLVGGTDEDYNDFKWWADDYNLIDMNYVSNSCLIKPLSPGVVNIHCSHPKAATTKDIVLYISKYSEFAFEKTQETINSGSSTFINMEVPATYLEDCKVSYRSSKPELCNVTGNNYVCTLTANEPLENKESASCTIYAELVSKGGVVQAKAELLVVVNKKDEAKPYIAINGESTVITLNKGEKRSLSASLYGSNITDNTSAGLTWSINDGNGSFVKFENNLNRGKNVVLEAVSAGRTTIEVTHGPENGVEVVPLKLYVIVLGENDPSVMLDYSNLTLYLGEEQKTISATVQNEKVENIKWSLVPSNSDIVTMTTKGNKAYIYPNKKGSVQLQCSIPNASVSTTCTINVTEPEQFNLFIYDDEKNYTSSGQTITKDNRKKCYITLLNLIPGESKVLHYESVPNKDKIKDLYLSDSSFVDLSDLGYQNNVSNTLYPDGVGTIIVKGRATEGSTLMRVTSESEQQDSVTISNSYNYLFTVDKNLIFETPENAVTNGSLLNVNYEIRPGCSYLKIIPEGNKKTTYENLTIENATKNSDGNWIIRTHTKTDSTIETNIEIGTIKFRTSGQINAKLTIEAWNDNIYTENGSATTEQWVGTQEVTIASYYDSLTFTPTINKKMPYKLFENNQNKTGSGRSYYESGILHIGDGERIECNLSVNQQYATTSIASISFEAESSSKKDKINEDDENAKTQSELIDAKMTETENSFYVQHKKDYAIYRYKNASGTLVEVANGMENMYRLRNESEKYYEVLNDTLKEISYVGKIKIGYFDYKNRSDKFYYIPVYVNVRNTPCMTISNYYYY